MLGKVFGSGEGMGDGSESLDIVRIGGGCRELGLEERLAECHV